MKKIYCCWQEFVKFAILGIIVLFSTVSFGQFYKPGNAPTLWPPNGFGAEGDAYVNVWLYPTITPNDVGDWFFTSPPDPAYPGAGGSIFNAAGDTISPGSSNVAILAHFVDGYRGDPGGDLTVFAESDKIEDSPETYDVKPGSVPPKDDMQHADGVFTYGDPTLGPFVGWDQPGHETAYSAVGVATDLWCIFACDRWKINGASYADFEFNQNAIDFDPVTGLFTSHAPDFDADGDPTGGRTPGDVLITVEFTQGGAVGDVWVDKWLKAGVGQAYHWVTQDITTGVYVNALFASFNNADNHVPWPIYDQDPEADGHYLYEPNQYIEGAINLTQVMETTNQQCGTLATIWVRTKSSHSSTAQLKDLAGIFNVGIVPDPPVPDCPDPVSLESCPSMEDAEAAYDEWRAGFSYSGGTEPVTESFDPELPEDLPADALCGYELEVEYKVVDFCGQADSCTSSFSIATAVVLEALCPDPVIIDTFIPQADVDAQFAIWLAEFGYTGGCNPTPPVLDYLPPNHCGGLVEITYLITDECDQSAECYSYFIVDFVNDVAPLCPEDPNLAACTSLADIQEAYDDWVAGFIPQGTCPPFVTNIADVPLLPADINCGDVLNFTFITTDACDVTDECSATFTVGAPEPVSLTCPEDQIELACQTQEDIDAAFDLWLDEVVSGGGCNLVVTNDNTGAPSACGGFATVTWTAESDCEEDVTCSSTFSVDYAPFLDVYCPGDLYLGSCMSQDDVDAEFALWLAGFGNIGGCNTIASDLGGYLAPNACGGSVSILYEATDDCGQYDACEATFSVEFAPLLDAYCPGDVNLSSCMSQDDVDAEFALWIAGFGNTGGCNTLATDLSGYVAPDACGGSVSILYEVSDDCDQSDWCEATFSVAEPDPIVIDCPDPVSLGACTPSADITVAYDAWKLGFTSSGDCNLTDNMASFPPLVVQADGSVNLSFTYIVTGDCDNTEHSCSSTFTALQCVTECNTAYAKIADPNSRCFLLDGFSQWGWTNYIAAEGVYVLPMYAGAAGCLYSDDNYVGTATVTYAGGVVTVQYQIIAGFAMTEAHVNVSCDKYPKKKGKWTVAPGMYTFVQNSLSNLSGLTVSFTGVQGPIWVIIHAVTCDVQGSGSATYGPYALNLNCLPPGAGAKDVPVASSGEIDVNIYPNPFIHSTEIEFSLPSDEEVIVEVYNTLGEKVSTLFHEMVNADQKYKVRFSLTDLNGQGMYLCVVRASSGYIVKPMIVTR